MNDSGNQVEAGKLEHVDQAVDGRSMKIKSSEKEGRITFGGNVGNCINSTNAGEAAEKPIPQQ